MTVVAALNDVHGNLPALEAVLADPAFARADVVVVGGDVAAGPMPAAVLDRLRTVDLPVRWVRGNADREVVDAFDRGDTDASAHPDDVAARADAFTAGRITPGHRDLLASFEELVRVDGTLYCHGSPRSDEEMITALTPRERLAPMLVNVDEQLVVCGHTHHQFDLRAGDQRVVNAGSVGMPYEGSAGAYWLLVVDGEPELQRTTYDIDAAAAAIRASGFPDAEDVIKESLVEPVGAAEVARFFEDRAARRLRLTPDCGMFVFERARGIRTGGGEAGCRPDPCPCDRERPGHGRPGPA